MSFDFRVKFGLKMKVKFGNSAFEIKSKSMKTVYIILSLTFETSFEHMPVFIFDNE
jgi:hypothetical protein